MARSLLAKELDWWRPHMGIWPRHWLCGGGAGGPAVGWCNPAGLIVLYAGAGSAIDRETPAGAVSPTHAQPGRLRPWPTFALQPATTYWCMAVPIGPGGVEAVVPASGEQLVQVRVGDDGTVEEPTPAAPRELTARAVAAGRVRVAWLGVQSAGRAATATYAIFSDGGTGVMDWETPLATVPAGGPRMHSWESAAWPHGTVVQLGVRAIAASGASESNTATASAEADAEGPAAALVSAATIGEDE